MKAGEVDEVDEAGDSPVTEEGASSFIGVSPPLLSDTSDMREKTADNSDIYSMSDGELNPTHVSDQRTAIRHTGESWTHVSDETPLGPTHVSDDMTASNTGKSQLTHRVTAIVSDVSEKSIGVSGDKDILSEPSDLFPRGPTGRKTPKRGEQ